MLNFLTIFGKEQRLADSVTTSRLSPRHSSATLSPAFCTKRVAAKSIAAIPAESIPLIGLAVLIADTGYELYAACETVGDLDQLYVDLGMGMVHYINTLCYDG